MFQDFTRMKDKYYLTIIIGSEKVFFKRSIYFSDITTQNSNNLNQLSQHKRG